MPDPEPLEAFGLTPADDCEPAVSFAIDVGVHNDTLEPVVFLRVHSASGAQANLLLTPDAVDHLVSRLQWAAPRARQLGLPAAGQERDTPPSGNQPSGDGTEDGRGCAR